MGTFLLIYFIFLGMFWMVTGMFVLIDDDEGCYYVNYIINKDEWKKPDLNGWIKMTWLTIIWPIWVTYLFFRYGFIPVLKFFWKSLIFMFKVLIYPFKIVYDWIKSKQKNKKPSEPLSYKIAKWIVRKYHL